MLAGAGNDVGLLRSALALEHALALPVTTPPEGALTA
jgi:hypothetical protein